MHPLPILFADGDFEMCVQIVVIALFVIVPVLLKAFGGSTRQPDRTPRKPGKPQQAGAKMPGNRSSYDHEIEDFLRRAEAKRRGGAAGQPRPGHPRPQPRPQPQRQPVATPYYPAPEDELEIIEAQVVAQPVSPGGEFESRFESSISTADFEVRAQRLGDRVERADDAMEARMQSVFDHGLGEISKVSATVATADVTPAPEDAESTVARATAAGPSVAHRIATRLRTPGGMRDAIVLREILEPPEHRW
jgi:hypothetical protein